MTRTLPVEFVAPSGDGFVPESGILYPPPRFCAAPRLGRRRRRGGSRPETPPPPPTTLESRDDSSLSLGKVEVGDA